MQTSTQKPYRYLLFFVMLYLTISFVVTLFSKKIILIANHITMAGTLFIPFCFVLSDIIAEVYGYRISRQVIWITFLCHFIFTILCTIALKIPSPQFWHDKASFEVVLGNLLRITISGLISYVISMTMNVYFLSKWKSILHGKYFLWRSFFASTMGEFLYTILAVILIQYNILTWGQIEKIIITSYCIKIICTLISAIPASIIVYFLKKVEVVYDENTMLNPFKNAVVKSLC